MAWNELPGVSKEQLKSGEFAIAIDDGALVERPIVARLSEVESFPLTWLWPGKIPQEKVTFLFGPADAGKTLLAVDLAARVSRKGTWPDGPPIEQDRSAVLYVCDTPETLSVVGPRLKAAGADLDNVHLFYTTLVTRHPRRHTHLRGFNLPDDMQHLAYAIASTGRPRLVVIDSLSEFCPNAARETETARLLHSLALKYNVAIVVVVRSRGGREERPLTTDRTLAGARCAWSVSADPDDSELRHFAPARFSYGPRPGGMSFRIHDDLIAWEPVNVVARRRRSRAVEEVMLWLENLLQGQVLPCKMIQQQARECGFTTYSLRAARIELGVQIGKEGFNENTNWCWSLGVPAALPEPASATE